MTSDAGLPYYEHKIALISEDAPPFAKGERVVIGGFQTEVSASSNLIMSRLIPGREKEAMIDF